MTYTKGNNIFQMRVGSRAQVVHGTAYSTSGGLLKKDLKYNKNGEIVSKKKSLAAKKAYTNNKNGIRDLLKAHQYTK
jgi:hypothetical protein